LRGPAKTRAPDEAYEAVRSQFSEKELVDLSMAHRHDQCLEPPGDRAAHPSNTRQAA